MRCIGHLNNQTEAEQFGHFLYSQAIENQVDPHPSGHWEIWVKDEDQINQAKSLFQVYADNLNDPTVVQGVKAGLRQKEQLESARTPDRARIIDVRTKLQPPQITLGWITLGLIVISVGVGLLTQLGKKDIFVEPLLLILPRVLQQGEIWRLFSPMFLHFGLLHLFFNMMWMKDLGSSIERIKGPWMLLGLSFTISILSNVAQYFVSGPAFGGMSGVVFGLLGYMWMQGRFNPRGALHLNPQTVQFMIIWFVICSVGLVGNVANTAHGVGAFVGIAWGFIAAKREARGA